MSIFSYKQKPSKAKEKPEVMFGKVKFEGKDLPPQPATYERLAVGTSDELLLVSLVAELNFAKAIRAILSSGVRAHIEASEGLINNPLWHTGPIEPGKIKKSEDGYDCYSQKLDHGLVHCLFVSRRPGFLPSVTDEAIWQQLKSSRYTTPVLREWVPHIKSELVSRGHLRMASGFRCSCGVMYASDTELDEVVRDGLRGGMILIP